MIDNFIWTIYDWVKKRIIISISLAKRKPGELDKHITVDPFWLMLLVYSRAGTLRFTRTPTKDYQFWVYDLVIHYYDAIY